MYIQMLVKDVEVMQVCFDIFKQEYVEQLNSMIEEIFVQLKVSILVMLKELLKNLQDEVMLFMVDWYKENYDFDSKEKFIVVVEKVMLEGLKDFYVKIMLNKDVVRVFV